MKRVVISAGEASGDAYGSALILALQQQGLEASIEGIGGKRMEAAGMRATWVDRSGGLFDTLRPPPQMIVRSLTELADAIEKSGGD